MPRKSSRCRAKAVIDDSDEDGSVAAVEEEITKTTRRKRKSQLEDSDDDEEEETSDNTQDVAMAFTSQAPEMTQDIAKVKEHERNRLMGFSLTQRNKAISDLTRLVLFKALYGEPIDRAKCVKEACINDARISSAAFKEVNMRLRNMFDFELKRQPTWMNNIKGLNSATYTKDRYYLVNFLADEKDAQHI